jgi:hypothetical protein
VAPTPDQLTALPVSCLSRDNSPPLRQRIAGISHYHLPFPLHFPCCRKPISGLARTIHTLSELVGEQDWCSTFLETWFHSILPYQYQLLTTSYSLIVFLFTNAIVLAIKINDTACDFAILMY